MARFFRQALDDQFTGSLAYLDSQRSLFRNDRASGLFEIQATASELVILLFAGGDEAKAYRLGPESCAQISPAKIGTDWVKKEVPIRTVNLPSQASRAIWLALESQPKTRQEIRGIGEWNKLLEACLAERMTGLIEVASDSCDGFILLYEGVPVKSEAIFSTTQGFQTGLLTAQQYLDSPWQITIYAVKLASQAYQCALLRLSATEWSSGILARYRDLVGQKMLQTLNANLNMLIAPKQWDIHLVGGSISDQHFFPQLQQAVDAYREVFMAIGEQANLVLGNTLSQRLLGETFNQLSKEELALFEAQRLIPAAFLA